MDFNNNCFISVIYLFAILEKNAYSKPAAPSVSSVNVSMVYSTSIVLSFSENHYSTYKVKTLHVNETDNSCVGGEGNITTQFVCTTTTSGQSLQPTTSYKFVICAVTSNNESDPLILSSIATGPPAPTGVTTTSQNPLSLLIEWEDISDKTYPTYDVQGYRITYFSDDDTNNRIEVKLNQENQTKLQYNIANLMPNAEYSSISVTYLTDKTNIQSDSSIPVTGVTIPGRPIILHSTITYTTKMNISWNKPTGGDEITGYEINWKSINFIEEIGGGWIRHVSDQQIHSLVVGSLLPGVMFNVTVRANNSAGHGMISSAYIGTEPAPIQNLIVNELDVISTSLLKLMWNTPEGYGEFINVTYESTTTGIIKEGILKFYDSEITFEVQPGNNYTITATAKSSTLSSDPFIFKSSARPSKLRNVKLKSTKESLTLTWDRIIGYAEWIVVEPDKNVFFEKQILDGRSTKCSISSWNSVGDYNISVYSEIVNSDGYPEKSEYVIVQGKTFYTETTEPQPTADGGNAGGAVVAVLVLLVIVFVAMAAVAHYYYHISFNQVLEMIYCSRLPVEDSDAHGEDTIVTSRQIQLNDFKNVLLEMKSDSNLLLTKEFEMLQPVGRDQSIDIGQHTDNRPKNRYTNIIPYDHSIVKLSTNENDGGNYINANYIPGYNREREYISTQGPLPSTKDDFWRLVWEQKSKYIVMVTRTLESTKVKCEHYWPFDNSPIDVGNIKLSMIEEDEKEDWVIRRFELINGSEKKSIVQFHFTGWPDHGVPESTESLMEFVQTFRCSINADEETEDEPIIVHCSAGVGRTGTFIAMDRLLQRVQNNSYINIFGIVYEMRMHRTHMVQTQEQYNLLYEIAQDFIDQKVDKDNQQQTEDNSQVTINIEDSVCENPAFEQD